MTKRTRALEDFSLLAVALFILLIPRIGQAQDTGAEAPPWQQCLCQCQGEGLAISCSASFDDSSISYGEGNLSESYNVSTNEERIGSDPRFVPDLQYL